MSSVIDIVFDRDVDGYEVNDRYSLACVYFEKEFEDLARRLGVTPLSAFYSDDPNSLDNDFDEGFFDDPKELAPPRCGLIPDGCCAPKDARAQRMLLLHHIRCE